MVRPGKFDNSHLVCHFTVPLKTLDPTPDINSPWLTLCQSQLELQGPFWFGSCMRSGKLIVLLSGEDLHEIFQQRQKKVSFKIMEVMQITEIILRVSVVEFQHETYCAIWYHLHISKNEKNTHLGVLLLNITLLHGCFSRFFKLYK